MTLYQINETLKGIALQHPFIKEYGEGDIYEHLNSGEHKYGLSFLTVDTVDVSDDFQTLHGSLFFVDRLLADSTNKLQIQNTGIAALQQVLNTLIEQYPEITVETEVYTVFTAQFADLCAGVYATLTLKFANTEGLCEDFYTPTTKSITANGTYSVIGVEEVVVNVSSSAPRLQVKDVYITENGNREVRHDPGYDGMDWVNVITNVTDTEARERIAELEAEVTELEGQVAELEAAGVAKDEQIATLRTQIATLNNQIAQLNTQIADKDAQIATLNESLQILRDAIDDLQDTVRNQQETIQYKNEVISVQEDQIASVEPKTITENGTYTTSWKEDDVIGWDRVTVNVNTGSERIAELEAQVATLTAEKAELQSQVNTLTTEKAGLEAQVADLNSQIADLNTQITGLNTQIAEKDDKIAELQSTIESQQATIAQKDTTIAQKQALIDSVGEVTVTENGTYEPTFGTLGYNKVTVNVSGGGGGEWPDGMKFSRSTFSTIPNEVASYVTKLTDLNYCFQSCQWLTSVSLDLPLAVSAMGMFYACDSMKTAYLSIPNVTWTTYLFYNCMDLTSVSLYAPKTAQMGCGFDGCSSLTSVSLDLPAVSDIRGCFSSCTRLTQIDLNAPKAVDMGWIFAYCSSIQSADLHHLSHLSSACSCVFCYYSMSLLKKVWGGLTALTDLKVSSLPEHDMGQYFGFYYCTALNEDSLVNVINALPTTTGGYTCTLGTTNLAKLTDDEIAIATNKGWTLN